MKMFNWIKKIIDDRPCCLQPRLGIVFFLIPVIVPYWYFFLASGSGIVIAEISNHIENYYDWLLNVKNLHPDVYLDITNEGKIFECKLRTKVGPSIGADYVNFNDLKCNEIYHLFIDTYDTYGDAEEFYKALNNVEGLWVEKTFSTNPSLRNLDDKILLPKDSVIQITWTTGKDQIYVKKFMIRMNADKKVYIYPIGQNVDEWKVKSAYSYNYQKLLSYPHQAVYFTQVYEASEQILRPCICIHMETISREEFLASLSNEYSIVEYSKKR